MLKSLNTKRTLNNTISGKSRPRRESMISNVIFQRINRNERRLASLQPWLSWSCRATYLRDSLIIYFLAERFYPKRSWQRTTEKDMKMIWLTGVLSTSFSKSVKTLRSKSTLLRAKKSSAPRTKPAVSASTTSMSLRKTSTLKMTGMTLLKSSQRSHSGRELDSKRSTESCLSTGWLSTDLVLSKKAFKTQWRKST